MKFWDKTNIDEQKVYFEYLENKQKDCKIYEYIKI